MNDPIDPIIDPETRRAGLGAQVLATSAIAGHLLPDMSLPPKKKQKSSVGEQTAATGSPGCVDTRQHLPSVESLPPSSQQAPVAMVLLCVRALAAHGDGQRWWRPMYDWRWTRSSWRYGATRCASRSGSPAGAPSPTPGAPAPRTCCSGSGSGSGTCLMQ